jgi:hypothetical protein
MRIKANLVKESDLGESLIGQLRDIPELEIQGADYNVRLAEEHEIDLVLRVGCKGVSYVLLVEIKTGAVSPSVSLKAVESLRRIAGLTEVPMLAARSLSETTRSLLREHKVAYWDSSGSFYLNLPNALYLIDRTPLKQPREGREPRNPYKGSAAKIIHRLLLEPERSWKVTELANEVEVAASTSQEVLRFLEKQLWVRQQGKGPHSVRMLTQPGKLLDDWAANYDFESRYKPIRLHKLALSFAQQKEQLVSFLSTRSSWALTLEHGAHLLAPYVTKLPGALTVIVPDAYPWIREALSEGYREVPNGENLQLWLTDDHSPFMGCWQHQGLQVASPIQLYLDLFGWPRRGKEQAQNLREKVLRF